MMAFPSKYAREGGHLFDVCLYERRLHFLRLLGPLLLEPAHNNLLAEVGHTCMAADKGKGKQGKPDSLATFVPQSSAQQAALTNL